MPYGSNNPLPTRPAADANALRDAARSSYHKILEDGRKRFSPTSQANNHRSPGTDTQISANTIAPLINRMSDNPSPTKVNKPSPLRESTTTTVPPPTAKEDHVPNLANAARVTVPPAVAPVQQQTHGLPAKPITAIVTQKQTVTRPNGFQTIDNTPRAPVIPPSAPAACRSPASKTPGRSTNQPEVPGKNAGPTSAPFYPRHRVRFRVGTGSQKPGEVKTGVIQEGNLSNASDVTNVNGKRPIVHVEAPVDAAAKRRRLSDTTIPTQQADPIPTMDQSAANASRTRQFPRGENGITSPTQTVASKSMPSPSSQSTPIKMPTKSTLTPGTTRILKPVIAVKRESPPPPPPPAPIDIDAPPKSLSQVLGLPERTSGVLRVPCPVFKNRVSDERSVPKMRQQYEKEIIEKIKWARGRGIKPLVVNRVMWRTDGIVFDWEIPSEGMEAREQNTVEVENSTSRVPTTALDTQVNPPIVATTTTSPIPVNQSVAESPESSHQSSSFASSSTRATSTVHGPVVSSTTNNQNTTQASVDTILRDVVVKQEEVESTIPPTPAPSREVPLSVHSSTDIKHSIESASSNPLALAPQSVITSTNSFSHIAVCFLDRYTRCFDDIKYRNKLSEAYADEAIMSLQFNDLPTEGKCPRVGNPKKQGHCIVNFAERDDGRNLLLESDRIFKSIQTDHKLVTGRDRINARLASFEALTHFASTVSPREYKFNITPLGEYGCLLLVHEGDLFARKAVDGDAYVSLRFLRSFILRPNAVDSPSWIDWPWIVINDQMTLFHRPGIVCQCPP